MPAPPRVADLVIPIVMESASPTSTSEAPPPYPVISFLRSLGPTLSSLSEMNVTETEKSQPRRTLNHRKRSKPVPPPEQLIEPFGRSGSDILGNPSLTPKVDDRNSGQEKGEESDHQRVDTFMQRPTCSLSLLCYSRGYEMSKVRVASREIYNAESKFRQALVKQPDLCTTDKELFIRLKAVYNKELCGFWRRWFSLKSLRSLRLLSVRRSSSKPLSYADSQPTCSIPQHRVLPLYLSMSSPWPKSSGPTTTRVRSPQMIGIG